MHEPHTSATTARTRNAPAADTSGPLSNPKTARLLGVAVYIAAAGASVVLALTGGPHNPLGANVATHASALGDTYVTVVNGGTTDWNGVEIWADEYVFYVENVPATQTVSARLVDFTNSSFVPRPSGMYQWEQMTAAEAPSYHAASNYQPRQVRVECDLGTYQIRGD